MPKHPPRIHLQPQPQARALRFSLIRVDSWRPRGVSPAEGRRPRKPGGRPAQAGAGIPAAVSLARRRGGCAPAPLPGAPPPSVSDSAGRSAARHLSRVRNGPAVGEVRALFLTYWAVKIPKWAPDFHAQTGWPAGVGGSGPRRHGAGPPLLDT